jgi:hypothetical protein
MVQDYGTLRKSKYGKISKYHSQVFNFGKASYYDNYLLQSPKKNNKNRSRIIKIWKPLVTKFKKQKLRPSPCESATNFKIGFRLKGNDGNLWKVNKVGSTKKWIPVNRISYKKSTKKKSRRKSKSIRRSKNKSKSRRRLKKSRRKTRRRSKRR